MFGSFERLPEIDVDASPDDSLGAALTRLLVLQDITG
jgi:hypothetical protein